ncbi:MAG: hypothetical protein R2864_09180 [Syntrophotaleaceae bacterium]
MTIDILRGFLAWCTVINLILYFFSFVVCALAGDWVYRLHTAWFPMSREAFNLAVYGFMGLYKLLIIVFNVVPYIALVISG